MYDDTSITRRRPYVFHGGKGPATATPPAKIEITLFRSFASTSHFSRSIWSHLGHTLRLSERTRRFLAVSFHPHCQYNMVNSMACLVFIQGPFFAFFFTFYDGKPKVVACRFCEMSSTVVCSPLWCDPTVSPGDPRALFAFSYNALAPIMSPGVFVSPFSPLDSGGDRTEGEIHTRVAMIFNDGCLIRVELLLIPTQECNPSVSLFRFLFMNLEAIEFYMGTSTYCVASGR